MGTTQAPVGSSLLDVAHANHIDLEGACEGSVACSTCHVILEDNVSGAAGEERGGERSQPALCSRQVFDAAEEASEDEDDMLDMAFGLTETWVWWCSLLSWG